METLLIYWPFVWKIHRPPVDFPKKSANNEASLIICVIWSFEQTGKLPMIGDPIALTHHLCNQNLGLKNV